MYPYVFQTAAYSLRWENVMIMLGCTAGVWLAWRRAAIKGAAYQNMILDLSTWLIIAGILGARLWELLFTWELYRDHPGEIFAIWNGGMSIQGSILGGLIAALIFAWRRRVRVWELLDLLAPPVILGQAIGRIGCLTSGDAFGRPVSEVPWYPSGLGLVYAEGTPAHQVFGPVPLIPAEGFEMVLDFVILAVLLLYKPRREVPGRTALVYAILYSVARFGLEFLRADSLMAGGLKAAQLLSVIVIAVSAGLLVHRYSSVNRYEKAAG